MDEQSSRETRARAELSLVRLRVVRLEGLLSSNVER